MSNHIHLIIQSDEGKLSDLIRDFKKFIAKSILEKIQNSPESRREWMLERFMLAAQGHTRNKKYQFWQYGNHAEEIYSNDFMWSKLDYIHLNPVRSGIVAKASDYIYSSASNYIDNSGLLIIEKADNQMARIYPMARICLHNDSTRWRGYINATIARSQMARICKPDGADISTQRLRGFANRARKENKTRL